MKRIALAIVVLSSAAALAQGTKPKPAQGTTPTPSHPAPAATAAPVAAAAPAAPMDMSKMGPWARKPTNEKQTRKEIEAFLKQGEEATKKGDLTAAVEQVDFPVFMLTDDAKGQAEAKAWAKDEYVAMMKPFYENSPKDVKYTHKATISVLSDSLAVVIDDFTMTTGKQKMSGRNTSQLVKVGGQWKYKVMTEAGWGGMGEPDKKM
jgi:hypothetical protein